MSSININDKAKVFLKNADAFDLAANLTAQLVNQGLKTEDENQKWKLLMLTVPFSVNLAFATELYMKAIYISENQKKNKRVHDLSVLYSLLSDETQDRILSQITYTKEVLESELEKNKEAFEEMRYLENKQGEAKKVQSNPKFIQHLVRALKVVANEKVIEK